MLFILSDHSSANDRTENRVKVPRDFDIYSIFHNYFKRDYSNRL